MWKYIKRYIPTAVLAALLMVGEVMVDLLEPTLMKRVVDEGVLGLYNDGVSDLHIIFTLGLLMVVLAVLGGLSGALNNVFVHYTSQSVGNNIRKDCFRKIMALSFPQMDRFGTGSLITRTTNDITQIEEYIAQFIRSMIRTVMLTGGSIFFLFRLSPRFAWIVLCACPFTLLCIGLCLYRGNPLFTKLQARLDAINGILQEDISGIRIIKACVREVYEKARFGKANGDLIKTQLQVLVIFAFMNPVVSALMYIAVAVILHFGAYDVSSAATTPGDIMAALTYTTQILNTILRLVMLFQSISRGHASWKRVREVLNSDCGMKDGDFRGETETHGSVEFRNVSFAYPDTGKMILHDLNLKIEPGETVAIMGATGCGKTTLVNLIPRFYDVTEGEILVDGVDVRDYCQEELRGKVSVALQKSQLFGTTIRENIAWGDPNASLEDIAAAARIAQADGFISEAPDRYDTVVAERGMSLSGGQKQRVAIARAVLKQAEILIFDDSTSALDLKTEADLYDALNSARPNVTKIIVAQRVASVRNADKIVILEHGEIISFGRHQELLESCAVYRDIYDSQMGKGAEMDE